MPRVRRRAKRRRTGYTDAHVYQLLSGHDFFGSAFGRDDLVSRCDLGAMREAWRELRAGLLADWIAEHPGTRPYAWWTFDAPERRRRIDGQPHPFDNAERIAKVEHWRRDYPDVAGREACKLYYGMPVCLMTRDDFDAEYESEADYLDRLGLLTDNERAALAVKCAEE